MASGGRAGYGLGDWVKKKFHKYTEEGRDEDKEKWLNDKGIDLTVEEWDAKPFKEKLAIWGWKGQMWMPEMEKGVDYASGGIAGQLHLNQGGRARFENGLKVTDDDFYLGDPGFLRELPDPYKDLPEEEREMRKAMDEIMRRKFYKELSPEALEKLKIQQQIREQQRKDRGLPEGVQLLNKGGLAHVLGV